MVALQARQENELHASFQKFNKLSKSLEFSYQHLENHLSHLHQQLEEAKSQNLIQRNQNEQFADRLNAILTALPAGVVVLDSNGNVQEYNPAALTILGGPLQHQCWSHVVERAFELSPGTNSDVTLKDGRKLSLATVPLGSFPGQVIMINDLTETRLLEEKLNQHQRLKSMGEMAASLAHQIRTPIATSILHSAQLKNNQLSEDKRLQVVNKIMTQMRDLEKIVSNMLMFSRNNIEELERCSLNSIVDNILDDLQPQLLEKNITLQFHKQNPNMMVVANLSVLQSAIQNIVVNAIQAVDMNGVIDIALMEGPDASIELTIKDDGIGICVERHTEIFEPFITDKSSGTGLGLAVMQAIARAHNGDIYLLESELGKGSTFALRLPMVK